jgi:predicted RNase H-like HicB family nuclease
MGKKALTYTLEIERHDDGYLAYFPALPGCHTWGKTYEAAVRYAEEALTRPLEAPPPVDGRGESGQKTQGSPRSPAVGYRGGAVTIMRY